MTHASFATFLHLLGLVTLLGAGACASTENVKQKDASAIVAQPTGAYPCDVQLVLQNNCLSCHGTTPNPGVPVSLSAYDDTQADFQGEPLWHTMTDVVDSDFMPLYPAKLSADDKATLLAWLHAGAKPVAVGTTCE